MITIVGPGGMGKTRLALAVAREQLDEGRFEHSVAFVDLAPLSEVDQMPAAIAQALGLSLESDGEHVRSSEQQVIDFLRHRHLLLVLDNAEHLSEGAGSVADMLAAAPAVKILVTSRALLRLPGEQHYPLQGLDYTGGESEDGQLDTAAMVLFLQSARRVRPTYGADIAERRSIAEICQLVEGMPLAIELAAAWVTVMSAAEILAAIRQSLRFLESDLRRAPARHHSMEAVFDATWQRLNATERRIFAQLSVFRGGFTQNAVKYVADVEVSRLRTLADSSLVVYDHERSRYTIHELLRQYGGLRLADDPDLEVATHEAHSRFYLNLLRRRQHTLKSRGLQTDLQVLDAEVDNLSRAWSWAAAHGHVVDILETLDGLGLYLQWRGRADEGEAAFGDAAVALKKAGAVRQQARAAGLASAFCPGVGSKRPRCAAPGARPANPR